MTKQSKVIEHKVEDPELALEDNVDISCASDWKFDKIFYFQKYRATSDFNRVWH